MAELILALDLPDAPSAVDLLDQLPDGCPVKVGSVLFTRAGSGFIRSLVAAGHPVFLDLKWHDIPNTVSGAVNAAVELGVEMVTVHALGGEAMVRAAVAAADKRLKVVAVTALTSHDATTWSAIVGRSVDSLTTEVARLATLAMSAGADGIVCSAHELAVVKEIVKGGRIVVPGVRRADDAVGDQQRVASPETAIAGGATHLVVGRPVLDAASPAEAYANFRNSMGQ